MSSYPLLYKINDILVNFEKGKNFFFVSSSKNLFLFLDNFLLQNNLTMDEFKIIRVDSVTKNFFPYLGAEGNFYYYVFFKKLKIEYIEAFKNTTDLAVTFVCIDFKIFNFEDFISLDISFKTKDFLISYYSLIMRVMLNFFYLFFLQ